jgi:type 1 glutamine amidotransferase
MKRLLFSAALAALLSIPAARAAEPKRVIVCTVTTGFRHSSIPFAEKTLQKLADESKAFTIVEFVRQPGVDVPNAPRKPNPPKADANGNDQKRYENDLKKYEAEMAKWTPEMEKARKEAEGLKAEGITQALARLSPQVLNDLKIDGVIFANTTGDLPLPDKEGFIKWIEAGHAFIGTHSASDTFHQFPGYIGMLGGEFKTHGKQVLADLVKVDPSHPATKGLPDQWNIALEEMYEFKTAADLKNSQNPPHDRANIHALWMLRHPPQQPDAMEYAGVSWCKNAGQGRVFYTSLGHREDLWSDDPDLKDRKNDVSVAKQYQQHLLGGIKWALGLEPGDATPNPDAAK